MNSKCYFVSTRNMFGEVVHTGVLHPNHNGIKPRFANPARGGRAWVGASHTLDVMGDEIHWILQVDHSRRET